MNSDLSSFLSYVWQHQPVTLILIVVGAVLFVLLVIDTWRHRRKMKERHRIKHHHKWE